MSKSLCIYGAGGLGREFLSIIEISKFPKWEEILFIDDTSEDSLVNGIKVVPFEVFINDIDEKSNYEFIIANGEPRNRRLLCQKVKENGFELANIIADSAIVARTAKYGDGAVVHWQSILSTEVNIGNNVMVGKNAMLGHDVQVGDNSVISACSYIGGFTTIGDNSFVGAGAVLRDHIHVGKNCVIGLGSVVTKNVEDNSVMVGNPAVKIRDNYDGTVFGVKKNGNKSK